MTDTISAWQFLLDLDLSSIIRCFAATDKISARGIGSFFVSRLRTLTFDRVESVDAHAGARANRCQWEKIGPLLLRLVLVLLPRLIPIVQQQLRFAPGSRLPG